MEEISPAFGGWTDENHENLRLADDPPLIQTVHLQNTSTERFFFNSGL
jgi:hypothetical protein